MTDTSPFRTALELRRLDGDRFLAYPNGFGRERLFGGQVVAQALRAAGLTIGAPRDVHSLHSYFLRPGRPEEPLRFEVTRTRDGRAFSTRNVTAHQEGKPIYEMIASFHDPEPGEDWPPPAPPSVPLPDDLRPVRFSRLFGDDRSVEIRPVDQSGSGSFPISHPFWVRVTMSIGTEAAMHACMLAYLSDIAVVRAARAPGSTARYDLRVSLDHSIWFHRPPRVDEWLLYSMDPVAHVGTRGLAQGSIRTVEGTLIASVAQEALLRPAADHVAPRASRN
ncbi:acyl-CoA thioesterase [Actinomadura sp. HBU206391]|uniref:acyl-CoA thioesterase n=1 Tax=Actinomadura sp. HBU206391 TaxID=2731692 RepID=UPI0016501D32|nr:acyl-CoA thioesterase domain-containing protein [Actinomadura sp. HBU206391]MBC6460130.1 thioesterase family protein [Actinomadura sp. HBU206391]